MSPYNSVQIRDGDSNCSYPVIISARKLAEHDHSPGCYSLQILSEFTSPKYGFCGNYQTSFWYNPYNNIFFPAVYKLLKDLTCSIGEVRESEPIVKIETNRAAGGQSVH